MAKRREDRREEMRALLARQESSGQSVAAFARRRGISAWTLYAWKRRLAQERGAGPGQDRGFVEVQVVGSRKAPPIELELPQGVRVVVPSGVEEEDLRRVLAVLSSC